MTFRARLALLFVVTMTALVVATSTATYLVVRSNLQANARHNALDVAKAAAAVDDTKEVSLDRIAGPGARVWLTDSSGTVVSESFAPGGGDASIGDVNRTIAAAPGGASSIRWPRRGGGFAIVLLTNSTIDSSLSTLRSTLVTVGLAVVAASALLGALLASQRSSAGGADATPGRRDPRRRARSPDRRRTARRAGPAGGGVQSAPGPRAARHLGAAAVRRRCVPRAADSGHGAAGARPHRCPGGRSGRSRPDARIGPDRGRTEHAAGDGRWPSCWPWPRARMACTYRRRYASIRSRPRRATSCGQSTPVAGSILTWPTRQ